MNGLLLLAQADAGELQLDKSVVDLSQLVVEVADMFLPLAEERQVALRTDSDPSLLVRGDHTRLHQLLTNLIENAIKFTEPGGTVHVVCDRQNGLVRVAIADNGLGIPQEDLPHIFERFYRVSSARSPAGSGLDLSICRWVVEAHGGSIRIASTLGQGTTVTATLPAL